jgi:hypothetical protein
LGADFELNAKFIRSLIDVGYVPGETEIAHRLGVPLSYVEQRLKGQSVRSFIRECALARKRHLDSQ